MLKKYLNYLPEIISRIVIGSVFIQSGFGKLNSLDKVIGYFESLGIPFAHQQAPLVAGVELIAGLFILIGLLTRLASLPLIAIMMVAIWTAKREEISDFSSLTGLSEFLYIVILIWILAQGSKVFAIDLLIKRKSVGST